MVWYQPILKKQKLSRTIFFDRNEYAKLQQETDFLNSQFKSKKLNISDTIRIKLFYVDEFVKVMRKKKGGKDGK